MDELEKLEEQIEKLEESLETADDFDDVHVGHMELDELRIKRNRLMKSLGIEAPPQSVYDKDYAEQLNKDFTKDMKKGYPSELVGGPVPYPSLNRGEDDFAKKLEERKKAYRMSGMGIDFNKERTDEDHDKYAQELADALMRTEVKKQYPTDLNIAYTDISFGVDIEAEQVFQQELHGIVDEMKVKLVDEKKILEGTLNPQYGQGEWGLPHIEKAIERVKTKHEEWLDKQNELSNSNPVEEQWKSDSQNGSLIIDPTRISTQDSSSSSSIVEPSSLNSPIVPLRRLSTSSLINSCSGNSADSGSETDAMNESSECTVPMISAPMLGMPNEARWSQPLRSMESLVQNLLGEMS